MIVSGQNMEHGETWIIEKVYGSNALDNFKTWDFTKVGIIGLLFSIFWFVREKILMHMNNRNSS